MTLSSPSKPVDKEPDGEGTEDASNGEDGHRDGPDGRERRLADLSLVALQPRLIDESLNHLTCTQSGG